MSLKPNRQMQGVGIGGIAAAVVMGLVEQLWPGAIDFSADVVGQPLSAWFMLLGAFVAGWWRGGADPLPAAPASTPPPLTALVLGVAMLGLAACGSVPRELTPPSVRAETPAQRLYALQRFEFNSALDAIYRYASLPPCGPGEGPLGCKKPEVARTLGDMAKGASAAIREAQEAMRARPGLEERWQYVNAAVAAVTGLTLEIINQQVEKANHADGQQPAVYHQARAAPLGRGRPGDGRARPLRPHRGQGGDVHRRGAGPDAGGVGRDQRGDRRAALGHRGGER